MNAKQPLVRAVATVLTLDPDRARLDEAERARLAEAEQMILANPPRALLAALLLWNGSGRLTIGR